MGSVLFEWSADPGFGSLIRVGAPAPSRPAPHSLLQAIVASPLRFTSASPLHHHRRTPDCFGCCPPGWHQRSLPRICPGCKRRETKEHVYPGQSPVARETRLRLQQRDDPIGHPSGRGHRALPGRGLQSGRPSVCGGSGGRGRRRVEAGVEAPVPATVSAHTTHAYTHATLPTTSAPLHATPAMQAPRGVRWRRRPVRSATRRQWTHQCL